MLQRPLSKRGLPVADSAGYTTEVTGAEKQTLMVFTENGSAVSLSPHEATSTMLPFQYFH